MAKYKYEIEGKEVVSDTELSVADIDEIGHSIRIAPVAGKARMFSEGLEHGAEQTVLGVRQFASSMASALGLQDDKEALTITDTINRNRTKYGMTAAAESLYGKTGEVIGETLPYMAVPIGTVGGVVGNIAQAGIKSGAIESMKPTASAEFASPERVTNALTGAITGGGVQGVFEVGGIGVNMVKSAIKTPKGELRRVVGKEDLNKEVVSIADEYGIKLTPFEATRRPELAGIESDLNPDSEDLRTISDAFLGDAVTLARVNDDFIESIFEESEETGAIITRGYSALKTTKDKGDIKKYITEDPYLNRHYEEFLKDKEEMALLDKAGVSNDSLAFINAFRKHIRDKAGQGRYVKVERGLQTSTEAGRRLTQASNEIRDTISTLVPEFAQANKLVRYRKTKESLMNTLNDAPSTIFNVKGEEIEFVDPSVMFKSHFGTNKQFENLKRALEGNPDAIAKLEKIRAINKALSTSPLRSKVLKAKESGFEPEGGGIFGVPAAVGFSFLGAISRKNQAAMLKYITNDNWQADIFDTVDPSMLRKGSYAALQQLQKAVTLVSAAGATQSVVPEQQQAQ